MCLTLADDIILKVGTALIAPSKNFIYDRINEDRIRGMTEEKIKNEF